MIYPSRNRLPAALALSLMAGVLRLASAVQLDVFAGYDGLAHAGGWFPVAIEVFNDGPTFDARFEVTGGHFGTLRHVFAEQLPNGTRKRFVVPSFAGSQSLSGVEVRLFGPKGALLAEKPVPLGSLAWDVPLLGAIPDTFAGTPRMPSRPKAVQEDRFPRVARLDTAYLPENPLALEGLSALYLNASKASRIGQPQAEALIGWVNAGGHLIVAADQPSDVAAAKWLLPLLPLVPTGTATLRPGRPLEDWLLSNPPAPEHAFREPPPRLAPNKDQTRGRPEPARYFTSLPRDPNVAAGECGVIVGTPAEGAATRVSDGGRPLIFARNHGRGLVTFLAANPEREPLKSWTLLPQFWAAVAGVPAAHLVGATEPAWGLLSLDPVFGSMIETLQVKKLPVVVLLLLLAGYLVVIGPFDRWLVRRLGRPMLTWITFPSYVVLFSLLIYGIGFKLRAGKTEWTELHVVDVLPMDREATRAALRGRTFTSLYSPANATYRIRAAMPHAAFRREFRGFNHGSMDGTLVTRSDAEATTAEATVAVWTSQMNVAEWADFAEAPIRASFVGSGTEARLRVENRSDTGWSHVWVLAHGENLAEPVAVPAGQSAEVPLRSGTPIEDYVSANSAPFGMAAARRQQVFGGTQEPARITDWASASVAASFIEIATKAPKPQPDPVDGFLGGGQRLVGLAGLDLTAAARRGDTVVLAWMDDGAPVGRMNQFAAALGRRAALLRLVIPAATRNSPLP